MNGHSDPRVRLAMSEASRLGVAHKLVQRALTCYQEPNRHYHGLNHVLTMLYRAKEVSAPLSKAQYLAVLFHDAVYVPNAPAGTNERASAVLMVDLCREFGINEADVALARQIVLDTTSHIPTTEESALVLDLDLSGLGQDEGSFNSDTRQVYAELAHLYDWEQFCVGRNRFFASILKREKLYHSPWFVHLESAARLNMTTSIESLAPPTNPSPRHK